MCRSRWRSVRPGARTKTPSSSAPARSRWRRSTWVRHTMPGMGKDPSPSGSWRKATNFKALKGKRVGVGPSGGPPEVFFRGLAEMLSVKATLVAGTPAELAQKLLAKEIDAFWYGSGIPSPPFVEIAEGRGSGVRLGPRRGSGAAPALPLFRTV